MGYGEPMKVFLLCSVGHFGLFLLLFLVGLDFSGVPDAGKILLLWRTFAGVTPV